MAEILTGVAGNTISSVVIAPLIELIDDLLHVDQNRQLLQDRLTSTKSLLQNISNQFEHDQRSPPGMVTDWLQRLQQSLEDAESVIDRSQTQKWCLDCFICKPRVSRQIKDWNTNFDQLLSNLQRDFQVFRDTQQIASSTTQRPETLLQPVPELGFVGLGIQDAEKMVQTWVNMEDRQFLVIGIYGLGGIGKTSLLKTVYNTYKTGNVFQAVIWVTVSQTFNILNMQNDIAKAINLELGSTSSAEMRKMELFRCLKEKKFLLILDDMWSPLDLDEEVGIPVGNDKGSRVIISTRSRDVIRRMGATDHSIQVEPLSEEEGWELFCRKAFKDGRAPTKSIEEVARLIAGECKGLPLAINVVAAAMIGNATVDEWNLALSHMKIVDPDFLNYRGIDEGLYQRLKWSYNRLPDSNFQNCFLYCGAFPEDASIGVETLVEMWVGEGLVQGRETSYLMDKGREYVKLLVDRCLFEDDSSGEMRWIKAHDIVRDMAIYMAEKEEKCFFRTSQHLQKFPVEKGMENWKRIAVGNNAIPFLPTDLTCPSLLSLLLPQNGSLTEVPNGFFLNLTSLRVLDMSGTKIESLPGSMWHLTQLEYLALTNTPIKNLPEEICKLGRLQFLHLSYCEELELLPSTIGELKDLKHLDLEGCRSLTGVPREISHLSSLIKLDLEDIITTLKMEEGSSGVCSLKDLGNLANLMELSVGVKAGSDVDEAGIKSGIKVGTMGSWVEMRRLRLDFHVDEEDDVVEDLLPADMHNMKKLQLLTLYGYCGTSVPNCICDFNQLEFLWLYRCSQLRELPLLERLPNLKLLLLENCRKLRELGIGRWGSAVGFPMLDRLVLYELPSLESMTSSSSNIVWSEGFMPKLRELYIYECPSLKRVPKEVAKLPNLREIHGPNAAWWEGLIWEDDNVKKTFEDKLREIRGTHAA